MTDLRHVPSHLVEGNRSATASSVMQRRLAAIFCADIVGYSRLVGLDEAETFQRVMALRAEVLNPLVAQYGGRIVSYAGDGVLAEFSSVVRAVECALAVHSTVAEREQNMPPEGRVTLRIGIHSGDILADSANDLCGDAVNVAARLEQLARPGGICLSDRAYEEINGRIDATFAYGGEPPLKNIGHRVGVWFWPAGDGTGRAPKRHSPVGKRPKSLMRGPRWPELFESVPPRDLNFTGREDALSSLHQLLMQAQRPAAIAHIAVHGLSGIGKTTLAAEYAHRYAGEYAGVWWAPAETRSGLLASLVALAARLDLRPTAEADQETAARAALAHVGRSAMPYLLVYDNVETPDVLRGLVPAAGVRLILTTRWADWSGRAEELKVAVLQSEAAVELLQKRAGRTDKSGASRLAEALGCLPLALDHAGAYCRLTGLSFDAYRTKIDQVIAHTPKGAASPISVGATFGLALQKAAAGCPAAERLLGLCAYLAPERIPLDLIASEITGEEERAEALMTLTAVSLIKHVELGGGEAAVTVHRLVQAAMHARLAERGETKEIIEQVTRRLSEAFPERAYRQTSLWPRCAALLPHVLAVLHWQLQGLGSAELARLYHATGIYLHLRGAFVEAEQLYKEAVMISEKVLGREHPNVAHAIGTLAHLYRETGRYAEAEPLLTEALAISEKTLGHEHADVAICLGRLARLYTDMERYEEAEPLFAQALAIGEKALGREHPTVAIFIGNLAILYRETGRYAEAEPLYKEAIAIGEESLGHDHPDVAIWLHNLALMYFNTGRYAEAEPLFEEAIAIDQRTLGHDHPTTARGLQNFAALLLATGRNAEALHQANAALTVCEQVLGTSHPSTTASVQTCAAALTALGHGAEAMALLARYGLACARGDAT